MNHFPQWLTWKSVRLFIIGAIELGTICGVATWSAIGAYNYGVRTNWSLDGLLTLLDTRWKAVLLLGSVLLYGTLYRFFHDVLNRISKFRAMGAEVETHPILPAGVGQKKAIPVSRAKK